VLRSSAFSAIDFVFLSSDISVCLDGVVAQPQSKMKVASKGIRICFIGTLTLYGAERSGHRGLASLASFQIRCTVLVGITLTI